MGRSEKVEKSDLIMQRKEGWIRGKYRFVVIAAIVCVCLAGFAVAAYWFKWDWTGFSGHIGPNVLQYQPEKTLWDWLSLLGVLAIPVVVAFGAAWFTTQQGKASEAENKDNQREAALQSYIDKMSELLLKKGLLGSERDVEARNIARVRTLTVLRNLNPARKASVLSFLHESGLLHKDGTALNLKGADFSQTDLSIANLGSDTNVSRSWMLEHGFYGDLRNINLAGVNLRHALLYGINLKEANLSEAYLSDANLAEANLESADLTGARFRYTILENANLTNARLHGAYLHHTYLKNAKLTGADLSNADFKDANLEGADLQGANLEGAIFTAATMPDGKKHP